ncbi:MAG TPA: hypothetical protein ENN88_03995 [Candidatus Coatesbacteria bacterium]|nr:hypothetical protein [Candidatus Coatesbacteria bacterium]
MTCTTDPAAPCGTCGLAGRLLCKWDARALRAFLVPAISLCLLGLGAMALTGLLSGAWWPLAAYGAFMVFFFPVFEIRILCSHCPFYAGEGFMLRCPANHGAPRLWRYRPGPMRVWEKAALLAGFAVFGGAPLATGTYNIIITAGAGYGAITLAAMSGLAAATLFVGFSLYVLLRGHVCPRCVNFSCPLNLTPETLKREYLRLNPEMQAAWERAGYRLD